MSGETGFVLAVDDEESIRLGLQRGLKTAGYRCITAENTHKAEEAFGQESVDLVLLDINIPGQSGAEFLPQIINQHHDVAVMML